jgi:hypothetical protein
VRSESGVIMPTSQHAVIAVRTDCAGGSGGNQITCAMAFSDEESAPRASVEIFGVDFSPGLRGLPFRSRNIWRLLAFGLRTKVRSCADLAAPFDRRCDRSKDLAPKLEILTQRATSASLAVASRGLT